MKIEIEAFKLRFFEGELVWFAGEVLEVKMMCQEMQMKQFRWISGSRGEYLIRKTEFLTNVH